MEMAVTQLLYLTEDIFGKEATTEQLRDKNINKSELGHKGRKGRKEREGGGDENIEKERQRQGSNGRERRETKFMLYA